MIYENFLKRFIDFLASFMGLVILSPILFLLTFLLILSNKGSAFFIQQRPGINARVFKLIKFKTMNDKQDNRGRMLPDKDRLTSVGRFMRSTSLDELPQLINVLKGDMSLVGPRPLLVKYLPLYTEKQARRHDVRPGITGWTQVNGRNSLSWEQKFELDVWYVDNMSFALDMKILWLTLKKVIIREGISQEGQATIEAFVGRKELRAESKEQGA